MADNTLYELLGLPRTATDADVRKQYRKLAKEHHPDKNPAAGDKFKEISFAYDVLSDPNKRELYDRFGMKGLQEGSGDRGGFGMGDDLLSQLFGGGGGPFGGSPFSSMFGGMGGFGGGAMRGGRRGPRKGENTLHRLKEGGRPGALQPCRTCNGRGIKITISQLGPGMVQQMQSRCPDCDGEGEIINERDRCKTCSGRKVTPQSKLLEVNVDKGMKDDQRINFYGDGDQMPGVEPGDVVIQLQEKPHEVFQRRGNNLVMKHQISLTEALSGFTFVIKHLDGRHLAVNSIAGEILTPGVIKRVIGEGMPVYKNPFHKGDLFVQFDIIFPDKYFATEEKLKELEVILGGRPVPQPIPPEHEEVNLTEFDPASQSGASGSESYDSEEGAGGPQVRCAHQ